MSRVASQCPHQHDKLIHLVSRPIIIGESLHILLQDSEAHINAREVLLAVPLTSLSFLSSVSIVTYW